MCTNGDGPHKNRAIETGIDTDRSGLKDELFSAEDGSRTSVTSAVLDTVDHLATSARGDQGASVGAVIETILKHTEFDLGRVLNEVARLETNGDIYVADGEGRRVKLTKVMADGGQDLIDCCPECEKTQFFPINDSHVGGAATHGNEYRCQRCKHTFDEPDQRESKQDNPTRRGIAGKLAEIGESKETMADGGQPPWQDEELLSKLYLSEGLTTREIADRFDCSNGTVSRWLNKYDIDTRENWAAGVEAAKRANRVERVKLRTLDSGYEYWTSSEWRPGQDSRTTEIVYVHRLLAVAEHGFKAVANRDVHHENGIPWDNRPSNVDLLDKSEHGRLHSMEYHHGGGADA